MVEADPLHSLHLEEQIHERKQKAKQLELYIKTFRDQTASLESEIAAGNADIDKKLAEPLKAVEQATDGCKNVQNDLLKYFSQKPTSEVEKVL